MQSVLFVTLLVGASALGVRNFAKEKCHTDKRITALTQDQLKMRLDAVKTARPWMLKESAGLNSLDFWNKQNLLTKKASDVSAEFLRARADAFCSRAELLSSESEHVKNELLALRKKCLEAQIALGQKIKAGMTPGSGLLQIDGQLDWSAINKEFEQEEYWKQAGLTSYLQVEKKKPHIEKVFYINSHILDGGAERKKQMEEQLTKSGVSFERWRATIPHEVATMPMQGDLPTELLQFSAQGYSDAMKTFPQKEKFATAANYLSHVKLLQHIMEHDSSSDNVYVIMEDDVVLKDNWQRELEQQAMTLPKDWDMAKFVYHGMKRCEDKVPKAHWYELRSVTDATPAYAGSGAYMFRAKSIKNILEQIRGMPVMDIDGAMISNHNEHNTPAGAKVWGMFSYAIEEPLGEGTPKRDGSWSQTV